MSSLSYFVREDTRTFFALNRVYGYEMACDFAAPTPVVARASSPEEFAAKYLQTWNSGLQIAERLFRWAGDAPIRFLSEHDQGDLCDAWGIKDDLGHITGSAYDSDYEADGITYKPGSAW